MNDPPDREVVGIGERDRPGRSSWRPGDWFTAPQTPPEVAGAWRREVLGGTPKTAGRRTPWLPGTTPLLWLKGMILGLLLCSVSLHAQSYSIDWFTIDGGGGVSTGDLYSVSGTIGQQDANPQPMSGGNFSLAGGFWSLFALQAPEAAVVGRYLFYNQSAFDGNDPAANPQDDGAIAIDKRPLLPGQTASFANYTSYSKGINGIMVDIARLVGAPGSDDFTFKTGNSADVANWTPAPPPLGIYVRPGAGTNGSSRVTILWPNNAIQKQWLQVTVRATAVTGLGAPDLFYFGNAIGESGNSAADAKVNATDEIIARNNARATGQAPVDFRYDYNRDSRVNATDEIIARNNATSSLTALHLITPPVASAASTTPFGATTDAVPGAFSWTGTDLDIGSHTATDRVADKGAPTLSDRSTFPITAVGQPRIANVSIAAGNVTLTWVAIAGKTYRVQYKNDLTETTWGNLSGDITAGGATATKSDTTLGTAMRRFYRIELLP